MGSLTNSSCFSTLLMTLYPAYPCIIPARTFPAANILFFFFLTNLNHLTIEILNDLLC